MINDYGFNERKAYLDRARDERLLNNNMGSNGIATPHMPKSRVARNINKYHKQARFDNTIHMGGLHKEGFNRNFNRNI